MLKKFFWPDRRKFVVFVFLLILLIPISIIGAAAMERADSPSSKQPLLESLEESLGVLGQFIIAFSGLIYLIVIIAPMFFIAFITQSSSYGFVLGIVTAVFLVYIIACLLDLAPKKSRKNKKIFHITPVYIIMCLLMY